MPEYKLTRLLDLSSKVYKMIQGSFPGMSFDDVLFVLDVIRDSVLKAKAEKDVE